MEGTVSLDGIAATVAGGAAAAAGGGAAAPAAPAARPADQTGGGLYSGVSGPAAVGDVPPLAPTLRRDPAMDFRLEEPALEECAPCANVGPPPECPVCKHHHFQGTACDICGHVGKTVRATRTTALDAALWFLFVWSRAVLCCWPRSHLFADGPYRRTRRCGCFHPGSGPFHRYSQTRRASRWRSSCWTERRTT
jgi:hypothetical protein